MQKPDYSGRKILFTAFSVSEGSEELAGYDYITRHGATDISAFYWGGEEHVAKMPPGITSIPIEGNNTFDPQLTAGYDLVFRHQTTRPDLIKSPSTTNTNEFFKHCSRPIIAVTGTKGKGTTSTLISEILDEAGVPNRLLGNMGNTAIKELDSLGDDEVVVFEISSFQLWDLQYSPHVAVVLMMSVDHQDVHASVEEYIQAKSTIVKYQTEDDLAVHHPDNEMTLQTVGTPKSRVKRYFTGEGAHIENDTIVIDDTEIMPVSAVGLRGPHNLENVCAAITAAWEYTQDVSAIARAVGQFMGLESRLEIVAEKGGVTYVNDSFSTTPVATIAAVHSFEQPISLIVGGSDKGSDYTMMAKEVAQSTVEKVVAIGETRHAIAEALRDAGVSHIHVSESKDMAEIVDQARQDAPKSSVVLLSPGCASFDLFKNYKDRAQKYKTAVGDL